MKNQLRALRAAQGWSQAELAERLGVSRQTVNALEVGKYDPSLPLAFTIARLFGRAIEVIFEPDPPPSSAVAPAAPAQATVATVAVAEHLPRAAPLKP